MIEQDKLAQVLAGRFVENDWGEMVRQHSNEKLKFVFRPYGLVDDGVRSAALGFHARTGDGRWMVVMEWVQIESDPGKLDFCFHTVCTDGSMPFYDHEGKRSVNSWVFGLDKRKEAEKDLYRFEEIPEELDVDLTAELFRDQVVRGDFSRPVLFPAGKFKYEPPVHLGGDSYAYSMNVSRAALLLRTGRNAEEERAYEALWRWVVAKEIQGIIQEKRI